MPNKGCPRTRSFAVYVKTHEGSLQEPHAERAIAMTIDIDQVKFELLSAYKRGERVDIALWVQRFPDSGGDLLDFWVWVLGAGRREHSSSGKVPGNARSIAEDALGRACLAISLGPEWLVPLVAEAEAQRLASQVGEFSRSRPPHIPPAKRAFRRAVVCAWIVQELSSVRERVSRLAAQKTTYLLESALILGLFDEHQQRALGPYDHTARYKDAEPIAIRKNWINVSGSTLTPGNNLSEIEQYADRYLRSVRLARTLTRLLGKLTDDQLETWATVHWIAQAISNERLDLSVQAIKEALEADKKWAGKLQRSNFDEERIREALVGLTAIGLLPSTL